jgi:hypothetical protein
VTALVVALNACCGITVWPYVVVVDTAAGLVYLYSVGTGTSLL